MMDVLERVQLDASELEDASSLAAMSKKKLGYSGLANEVESRNKDRKLRAVLRELAIDPFSVESVKSYKEAARKKANEPDRLNDSSYGWFIGGLVALPVGTFITASGGHLFGNGCGFTLLATTLVVVVAIWLQSARICARAVLAADGEFKRYHWRMTELENYDSPVPEFVLQSALDIKERMSEAKFWINDLRADTAVDDPFLVVGNAENCYYIEVWNEPGFDKRRERSPLAVRP